MARSRWWVYGVAIVATLVTLDARRWAGDSLDGPALIVFTIPIVISAYLGGLGPGVLATALSIALARYFLLPPLNSLKVANDAQRPLLVILGVVGVCVSALCEALRRSADLLRESGAIAERARDELRASMKESGDLRTALDAHAIVARTDQTGRITFVNDRFCDISQYSREELLGQDHRIVNSGLHSKEFIKNLWTTIARGGVWHGEICNRAKDGSLYWVSTTIVPFLNDEGKPRQYVAIRADITERKRAEAKLQEAHDTLERRVDERTAELSLAKERAESADRLKSEFLASMSHELRTPLNAVIGFSELLVDEKAGPLSDRQKDYLSDVLNSARHLLQLINDILDLSKVEAGKMVINPRPFDLPPTVSEVVAAARAIARGKDLVVADEMEAGLPQVVLDQHRLKQALYNLLSNAVKFTKAGGTVAISTRRSGDRVEFRVTDTGIGISRADVDRLFSPFVQLNEGTARLYEGTGLGLVLTKKMVELQGGRIRVESESGKGSTFTIDFPLTYRRPGE